MYIYWQLYWSFCQIGLFCVGGGYASMPLIQQQVVTVHHWMNMSELINIFAISQMTPGPIGINAATFVGTRIAGVGGAIAATFGFVTPSVFIMVIFAKLFAKYKEVRFIKGLLDGVRPAVVALIASAGVMFVTLILWKKEVFPFHFFDFDKTAFLLLLIAIFIAKKTKIGVIGNLIICGIISLGFGIFHI